MTRTEAKLKLLDAFPGRSICLEIEDWSHYHANGRRRNRFVFTVSVQPGLNGHAVSQWEADNLDAAVTQALALACQSPATKEADALFAVEEACATQT